MVNHRKLLMSLKTVHKLRLPFILSKTLFLFITVFLINEIINISNDWKIKMKNKLIKTEAN